MSATISRLEALNTILRAMGQRPVNSVDNNSINAQMALQALDLEVKRLQTTEWDFNVSEDYTLSVDVTSGNIPVPVSITRFDVGEEPWIVVRGSRLYNRRDDTFVFSTAKTGKAWFSLEWDELPDAAKLFLIAVAARKCYDTLIGANSATRQSLFQEEQDAWRNFQEFDSQNASYSMFDTGVAYITPNYYTPSAPRHGRVNHERTQE